MSWLTGLFLKRSLDDRLLTGELSPEGAAGADAEPGEREPESGRERSPPRESQNVEHDVTSMVLDRRRR